MSVAFGASPAPPPFSSRTHLQALGRALGVAVVGLSVGVALAWSSSAKPAAELAAKAPSAAIAAPEWTYRGANAFGPRRSACAAAQAPQYIY